MVTKTQRTIDAMNYALELKQSGGHYCDAYSEIFKNLSDIFANQVGNGLKTQEESDDFYNELPGTEKIFNQPELHPDLSFIQPYYKETVAVHQAEMNVELSEEHAKVA